MRRKILIIFIMATIAFIWIHSMMQTDVSAKESGWVMAIIRPFLELFVGKGNVTQHLVRKLAHFTEFFILGCLACVFFRRAFIRRKRPLVFAAAASSCYGLAAAVTDELLQLTSPGRSCQISDMLLDLSGVLAGTVLLAVLFYFFKRRKEYD